MPTFLNPAELYPEVVAAGSLAAALQAAAVRRGLSVPAVVSEQSPLFQATVPTVAHRQALEVSASKVKRRWWIRGGEPDQSMALIEGTTADLGQVAKAAQMWHLGEPLHPIAELAPYVELTGRFEVLDRDPAQMIESEWQHLLAEAARADWPEYRALIDAAYADPQLRRLYPFTSHWSLRFSTRTRPRLSIEILVCIHPGRGEDFVVTMGYTGERLGRTATAQEAVSLAVRHLPADLGPTSYGATRTDTPTPYGHTAQT